MRYLASQERAERGTFDFPMDFHHVDDSHPRYEMPFHWHMEHELLLVREGALPLSLDGQTAMLYKGDSVLIGEGTIHGGSPQGCVYEYVVFDLERFLLGTGICGKMLVHLFDCTLYPQGLIQKESEAARLVERLFEEMREEALGYEPMVTGVLWQLLAMMLRERMYQECIPAPAKRGRYTGQLKNVLRRIRADYAEPLTLDMLAAEAAMAPKYFCRVFRQVIGSTPMEYLNFHRVECAAELLCSTGETVTEIALRCGFNDLSYFDRVFRRYKGISARAYRKLHADTAKWKGLGAEHPAQIRIKKEE